MGSTIGNNIKISLFGESHGSHIGVVIDGLAPGIKIEYDYLKQQLALRSAANILSTSRQEKDEFQIVSGVLNDFTTGTPLTIIMENKDVNSQDYIHQGFRPGHADYTGHIKYLGYNDERGGGHFSGRLSAPLVVAGALINSILIKKGITIGTHIYAINTIKDSKTTNIKQQIAKYNTSFFPLNDVSKEKQIIELVEKVRLEGDSLGGILQTFILNCPLAIGEPFFNSLESMLSHAIFSIPGVKGIEFGDGFAFNKLKGSQANDAFKMKKGAVITTTNHNGGINGGITNGMPIVFKTVFKPTASISKTQQSVNKKMEDVTLNIKGRHDPIIALRGRVVIDALVAFTLLDLITARYGYMWMV